MRETVSPSRRRKNTRPGRDGGARKTAEAWDSGSLENSLPTHGPGSLRRAFYVGGFGGLAGWQDWPRARQDFPRAFALRGVVAESGSVRSGGSGYRLTRDPKDEAGAETASGG